MINQVAAAMAIKDMPLTEQCYENLRATAVGEKTEDEVIAEITRKYSNITCIEKQPPDEV